jgi:hypothetical protein
LPTPQQESDRVGTGYVSVAAVVPFESPFAALCRPISGFDEANTARSIPFSTTAS